jgi:hypothetical protein
MQGCACRERHLVLVVLCAVLAVLLFGSTLALAAPRDQAKRIHDRIAGVPPSAAVLETMTAQVAAGDVRAAALTAMDNDAFYDVTLRNMVMPWTNEAFDVFQPLNDYVATVVGVVRDGRDFRQVLSADLLYVGAPSLGLPAYSNSNNAHYEALEASGSPLRSALVATTQSQVTGLSPSATAGVITSRASAKAFFIAGTNRAMLRFTLINHLCTDLEQLKDITRPPDRIRQDVTRSPGGDSRIFLNNCIGCHSGMDPLTQAFAFYDFEHDMNGDPDGENGRLRYNDVGENDPATGNRVTRKNRINADNFRPGYVTMDDRWDNYWRTGANRSVGWSSALPGSGNGARSLGQELANSTAFAQCHATHVFRATCLRDPQDDADRNAVGDARRAFVNNGYDLKEAFIVAADYCKGE